MIDYFVVKAQNNGKWFLFMPNKQKYYNQTDGIFELILQTEDMVQYGFRVCLCK